MPAQALLRRTAALLLAGGVLTPVTACGDDTGGTAAPRPEAPVLTVPAWTEPAAYTYTLTSGGGERSLIGTFRVTVRDGRVTDATGLDDSARRVVRRLPGQIPTLGDLLRELDQARRDHADTAEAEYADDGHPVRIVLDRDADALDDEAEYVIGGYEPGPAAG
ncbi:DUF6174 domain-containing protein [Streptomyces glaucescens]|uniref:Putative secreted protein n=1 Tax=Streptomyces glaucescens TaxID=1907 RepID=A0A089Z793_STRGA|nr:DUF6174 domain-containing protein [Streptomyces glaucescens]AIS01646.1 putative secreted protein [Streptomyces glaucescens]